jgi:DnaA family protein
VQQLTLQLAPPPAPTFDSFFPARNAAALAQLRALVDGEEQFVYVWGAAGSGKTHLLRSFVSAAASRGRPARYIAPGEDIHSDPGESVIACDAVHLLDMVGQLALFDLYNRFKSSGGALLTSGDRPPADLPLREDLRTRMGAGVVLRIEALSDEEKKAALSSHAHSRGIALAPDLLEYILERAVRDMGTQMAVIDLLDRLSLERKRPVTMPLVREVLQLIEQSARLA